VTTIMIRRIKTLSEKNKFITSKTITTPTFAELHEL